MATCMISGEAVGRDPLITHHCTGYWIAEFCNDARIRLHILGSWVFLNPPRRPGISVAVPMVMGTCGTHSPHSSARGLEPMLKWVNISRVTWARKILASTPSPRSLSAYGLMTLPRDFQSVCRFCRIVAKIHGHSGVVPYPTLNFQCPCPASTRISGLLPQQKRYPR